MARKKAKPAKVVKKINKRIRKAAPKKSPKRSGGLLDFSTEPISVF